MDFVQSLGYAPLHPFVAFPYERFEGNPDVGRKKTMEYCCRLIDACDVFGLFGISEGTSIIELPYAAKKNKPILPYFNQFDPDWRREAEKLRKSSEALDKILKMRI